jgi:hypothetical protein
MGDVMGLQERKKHHEKDRENYYRQKHDNEHREWERLFGYGRKSDPVDDQITKWKRGKKIFWLYFYMLAFQWAGFALIKPDDILGFVATLVASYFVFDVLWVVRESFVDGPTFVSMVEEGYLAVRTLRDRDAEVAQDNKELAEFKQFIEHEGAEISKLEKSTSGS